MLLSKVNLDISRAQPGQIGNVRNNSLVSNPAAAEIPIATSDAIRRPTSQVKARQDPDIADRLALARHAEARAHALARDIRTLTAWLGHDVLALAGPSLEIRQDLFDFIATEMKRREADDPRRIRPVRMALQNQRDNLLAFAGVLDDQLAAIARVHVLPEPLVRGPVYCTASPAHPRRIGKDGIGCAPGWTPSSMPSSMPWLRPWHRHRAQADRKSVV